MQYTVAKCDNCGAVTSDGIKALRLKKKPDEACRCGCKSFSIKDDSPMPNEATDLPLSEYRRLG